MLNLLDETARISPDKPEALVFKTVYLIKLKRNQKAFVLATKIDKQFPKLVLGKLLKGDVYMADKKLDKATDMYQQAYKVQPNDNTQKAIEILESIVKTEQDFSEKKQRLVC